MDQNCRNVVLDEKRSGTDCAPGRRQTAALLLSGGPATLARLVSTAAMFLAFSLASVGPAWADVEYCMGVGAVRAIASASGPVAEIVGTPDGSAGPPTMTLDRPALVGTCADLRVRWLDDSDARVTARMRLFPGGSAGPDFLLAEDRFENESLGREYESGELKAMTALAGVGTYDLLAVLEIAMDSGGLVATDSVTVPVRAIVPSSVGRGAVAGTVTGPDGQPVAGATIGLWPHSAPSGVDRLPTWHRAVTDSRGRYWLEAPKGTYGLDGRATWMSRTWGDGSAAPFRSDPLLLAGGAVLRRNDLVLGPWPPEDPLSRGILASVRVSETETVVGEPARVTYRLRHKAPQPGDSLHLAIVLDGSASMAGDKNLAVRQAAGALIDRLDLAGNRDTRIAIVEFSNGANVLCRLTNDRSELWGCIGRLSASGGTDIDAGLEKATWLLMGSRSGAKNLHEAIVLLTDGCNSSGCAPVLRTASASKRLGIHVSTVCIDYRCDGSCLRRAASDSQSYYEADPMKPGDLVSVLRRAADRLPLYVGVSRADVRLLLPEYLWFVAGSAEIAPVRASSHRVDWSLTEFPPYELEFGFEVVSTTDCPVVLEAVTDIRVSDGVEASYDVYLPATLPPPCVTATPTVPRPATATSAASPTPSPPDPIMLPIVLWAHDFERPEPPGRPTEPVRAAESLREETER